MFAGLNRSQQHFHGKLRPIHPSPAPLEAMTALAEGEGHVLVCAFARTPPVWLKFRRQVRRIHQEQLFLAAGAHHLDGGLVTVHENLPARITQEHGVGAALEQLSEHGLIIGQSGLPGTGAFVPVKSGSGWAHGVQ